MADRETFARLGADIAVCLGFFTRLPVPHPSAPPRFANALWAASIAGAVVGLATGLLFVLALGLGMPAGVAAALALGGGMLVTGALHEDGLADVADGFGGGRDGEAKLAIMRDSRIGTYGALALGLSVLLRWTALMALAHASPLAIVAVCVAAHAASRSLLPAFMAAVPPARTDGLSAGAGMVSRDTAAASLALGLASLVPLGLPGLFLAAIALAALFFGMDRLCRRQIGGQTGDVLGALQQLAEIAILVLASTLIGQST